MEDILTVIDDYVSPVSVYYLAEILDIPYKTDENLEFSKEICQALYISSEEWQDLKEFERDVQFEAFLDTARLCDPVALRFIHECIEEGRVLQPESEDEECDFLYNPIQ